MNDTPRTDGAMDDARNIALYFECKNPPPEKGESIYVVSAEFSRQIERELNESNTQLGAWHSMFGTTQITHAIAERDRLKMTIAKQRMDLDKLKPSSNTL